MGLATFGYELPVEGSTKRPDYTVSFGSTSVLCEIKELRGTTKDFNFKGGALEPYGALREKINACARQFKGRGIRAPEDRVPRGVFGKPRHPAPSLPNP